MFQNKGPVLEAASLFSRITTCDDAAETECRLTPSNAPSPFLGRVALVRGVAAYSHQTFPWTICRYVGASVCPVHCGKTTDRIRMPFGIVGRTDPGMRQIVRFGDRSAGGATFGRAIVTNAEFTALVCDNASTVGAAVWGGACGGPRHCCVIWASMSCKGKGTFGVFVPHFHNGRCHWVADGEMFPIRMRKLHNISVRQTYLRKPSAYAAQLPA